MNDGLPPASTIFVAGHRGLVGSAAVRALRAAGFANVVTRRHDELDLADARATGEFFSRTRPSHVVLAAAKVGGIRANDTRPAEFIHENLAIQASVIDAAAKHGVERLLFLGSSCIYPRDCPQPIREEYLLTGPLEPTNQPYALAKIAGIEMCSAYNRQYGTRFACAMPTNLFGPGDNYDPVASHVLPALIRKAHDAMIASAERIVVWGSGAPRREFLYSDDLAECLVGLLGMDWDRLQAAFPSNRLPLLNVGTGKDLTILELAALVCDVVGFRGRIELDRSMPDGTPQKLLDISRILSLGWKPRTGLREGIGKAYQDFLAKSAAVAA